jgi:hypothetical protein
MRDQLCPLLFGIRTGRDEETRRSSKAAEHEAEGVLDLLRIRHALQLEGVQRRVTDILVPLLEYRGLVVRQATNTPDDDARWIEQISTPATAQQTRQRQATTIGAEQHTGFLVSITMSEKRKRWVSSAFLVTSADGIAPLAG